MYLKKDHPWAPNYSYPRNVFSEPDRRGTLTSAGRPRGTIGNYRQGPSQYSLPKNVLAESPGQGVLVSAGLPRGTIAVKMSSAFRTPEVDVKGQGIYVPSSPVPRGDLGCAGSLGSDDYNGSLGGFSVIKNKRENGSTLGPTYGSLSRDSLGGIGSFLGSVWGGVKSVASVGKKVGCAAGSAYGGAAGRAGEALLCDAPAPAPPPPAQNSSGGISTNTLLLVGGGLAALYLITRK